MSNERRQRENDTATGCLVCGEVKPLQRGLCEADYQRFRRQKEKLPADQQDAFEESLIAKGLLLPSRQGQRNVENIFADELARFLAEQGQGGDPPPPVDSGAEVVRRVEQSQAGTPRERKVKGRGRGKKKGE